MSLASILFTSLLVFRSLSATLNSYAASFESKMTVFINEVASLFNFHFLVELFQPLVNLYGFLSNVLSHINFGPVAVQCSGSQAAMELLGNCLIIITVLIIVESEYATILLNVKELITNYIKVSLLDRILHGLDYYIHLLISVACFLVFSMFNPVQITVQFLASMVNIEQFYTIDSYVHSYSSYCDNYPSFTNIDIFMAYSCTAVTTLLIVPLVVIMFRLMIPNKVSLKENDNATRLEDEEICKPHHLVEPFVDGVTRLRSKVLNLCKTVRDRVKALYSLISASAQRRVPSCTVLNEKISRYDTLRQEKYNGVVVFTKPYLDYLSLRLSRYGRVLSGVFTVLSPDIVVIRVFIFWFSKVFRLVEYEKYLDDVEVSLIVSELNASDLAKAVRSTRAERVTETSREIVDRFTILDENFWKFTGKFTDDDENHAAFKADDEQKRESFYELMKQESKEIPATSRLLRDTINITYELTKFLFNNKNFVTNVFIAGVTASVVTKASQLVAVGYISTFIVVYISGVLFDIVSLLLLNAQGIS